MFKQLCGHMSFDCNVHTVLQSVHVLRLQCTSPALPLVPCFYVTAEKNHAGVIGSGHMFRAKKKNEAIITKPYYKNCKILSECWKDYVMSSEL